MTQDVPDPGVPHRRLRDVRMVPVAITAWAAALLVSFLPWAPGIVIGLSGTGIVLLFLVIRRRIRTAVARAGPLAIVCLTVAAAIAGAATAAAPAREQAASLAGHAVTAEVSVRSLPSFGADGRLWADADALRLGPGSDPAPLRVPVRIGIPADAGSATLGPGTVLRLTAQTKRTDPGERAALVLFASGAVEQRSRGGPVERIAGDVRAEFIARAGRLPEPGSELLPGLAVGDVRAVSDELDAAMKASGLSHLTAVSGRNIITLHASHRRSMAHRKVPSNWLKSEVNGLTRPALFSNRACGDYDDRGRAHERAH
ncbi:MAG: DUF4131 domain-containing protein [Microbacterium sp.]|uniref:DUF4131 domain-containing protein n=1 Tax=Microbacterium sp. TaxID=51671 RepID=UPI00282CA71C|nr:DUF4131 domain-containing protein [Microbacterium sp.]MDR2321074.1 DUF4131 domain-containing protein [Microbacterium sp.]